MQEGKVDVRGGFTRKGRKANGNRERERYVKLNTQFQRIARRGKKAFLNKYHKEVEENKRM